MYRFYEDTSDDNFFKIITGFMLTVKYQDVGGKSYLKTFYSVEEPIIYI